MNWADKYQQAFFRGVPFYVERAELEAGRRLQVHTFPNRETPYTEDLGRLPRGAAQDRVRAPRPPPPRRTHPRQAAPFDGDRPMD